MTRPTGSSSAFLRAVDDLCDDLRTACGLTRFSVMVDRPGRPITITFEDQVHPGLRLAPTAYLEVELTGGGSRLGYITVENSLQREYSIDAMGRARELVERHAGALRAGIPMR